MNPPYPTTKRKRNFMCANCGLPAAPGHWTEAGNEKAVDRLQARHKRARILRSALKPYGLTAHDDGSTPGIAISTHTGNLEIAGNLTEVWKIAERLSGRKIDPLASDFLGGDVQDKLLSIGNR